MVLGAANRQGASMGRLRVTIARIAVAAALVGFSHSAYAQSSLNDIARPRADGTKQRPSATR